MKNVTRKEWILRTIFNSRYESVCLLLEQCSREFLDRLPPSSVRTIVHGHRRRPKVSYPHQIDIWLPGLEWNFNEATHHQPPSPLSFRSHYQEKGEKRFPCPNEMRRRLENPLFSPPFNISGSESRELEKADFRDINFDGFDFHSNFLIQRFV